MKRLLACTVLMSLAAPAWAQDKDATSAAEKAARRIAALLKPGAALEKSQSGPAPRPGPRFLESPEAPSAPYRGTPPRLDLTPAKKVAPRDPREGIAAGWLKAAPQLPEAVELATSPPVRLLSVDVHKPIGLPILAAPLADRASLTDPTIEFSVAAALAKVTAQRTDPVPFTPLNLPDPFEHVDTVRLRFTPEELTAPPPLTPKTPR